MKIITPNEVKGAQVKNIPILTGLITLIMAGEYVLNLIKQVRKLEKEMENV